MYLYLVNFLRLLYGLYLLYYVTGVQSGIAVSRRNGLSLDSKPVSVGTEITSYQVKGNMMVDVEHKLICTEDNCTVIKYRKKRSTGKPDLPNAQNKQTKSEEGNKSSGKTSATKYGFGNPALPRQSNKRNGKPKSRRRKG